MTADREEPQAGAARRTAYVKRLFDSLAPVYDRGNALISLGLHVKWKRDSVKFAASALNEPPSKVLDGCCGTGDYAFISSIEFPEAEVTGFDVSEPMLAVANRRGGKFASGKPHFELGDLTDMVDFYGYDCDLFTIGFGLRNVPARSKALAEIRKAMRAGGILLSLDLAKPVPWFARPLMFLYLRVVMPAFSFFYTGRAADYLWLAKSLEEFPELDELKKELAEAGFGEFEVRQYGFGMVAAVRAAAMPD